MVRGTIAALSYGATTRLDDVTWRGADCLVQTGDRHYDANVAPHLPRCHTLLIRAVGTGMCRERLLFVTVCSVLTAE